MPYSLTYYNVLYSAIFNGMYFIVPFFTITHSLSPGLKMT